MKAIALLDKVSYLYPNATVFEDPETPLVATSVENEIG
jgi:hypothetical protein